MYVRMKCCGWAKWHPNYRVSSNVKAIMSTYRSISYNTIHSDAYSLQVLIIGSTFPPKFCKTKSSKKWKNQMECWKRVRFCVMKSRKCPARGRFGLNTSWFDLGRRFSYGLNENTNIQAKSLLEQSDNSIINATLSRFSVKSTN